MARRAVRLSRRSRPYPEETATASPESWVRSASRPYPLFTKCADFGISPLRGFVAL